jgi:hypothetical protein
MDAAAATRNVDYSVYLDAHDGATPCARDVLVSKLAEWKMPELVEDGSIIVAELVTNAGAPRSALSYPRFSREELKGGSWA